MSIEQIMIRLGIDGTAINSGLGKVGAQVKAWGASLALGMKEYFGSITKGFLGAEVISKGFEFLGEVKNKILEIARVSKETGANTNFVQSIMLQAEKSGILFEELTQGIARFNKTLGAAKMGDVNATKTLSDIGVITKDTTVRTLTFTGAMHNLGVSFDKLNDKQKQAYILQQAFGKGYAQLTPLFENGVGAIDKMSQGNFFTRISEGSIGDFETIWHSFKTGAQSAMATVANLIDVPVMAVRKYWQTIGLITTGVMPFTKKWRQDMDSMNKVQEEINTGKAMEIMADKDGVTVSEEKRRILQEQADLLEKQADLSATIADRDKLSVQEMDARYRRLTGVRGPLEQMHTVTPRMRIAHNIETLEERAKVAFLRGDDATSNRLQGEADQIRKANTWLKREDINPMLKTESELTKVNLKLEPVKRMAEMVTRDAK